jgi:hypothetical protein
MLHLVRARSPIATALVIAPRGGNDIVGSHDWRQNH